ncbi:MAG TPA: hypothetical protein VIL49_01105 [Capillimicrobium sp.]
MTRLPSLAALAAAALAATAVAAAPAAAQTTSPVCPTFTVLHNDRIGALSLPAGPYTITIGTPSTLSCSQASSLFAQFLQDFDGNLPNGWRVNAGSSSFSRSGAQPQRFSVARGTAPAPPPTPTPPQPFDGRCAGAFQVLHDDRIGALSVPAGGYTITRLSSRAPSCAQASKLFAGFLQDYDGVLPGRWRVNAQTGTFTRGRAARGVGFRIEPAKGTGAGGGNGTGPGSGTGGGGGDGSGGRPAVPSESRTPCPPFRVLHNDMVGRVRFPAGPYILIPLRGSNLSCTEASALFRQFLAAAQNALPSPWVVDAQTATFTRGRGSDVGFRVTPASS